MTRVAIIILIVVAVTVIPLITLHRYDVREGQAAELFWSSKDGYLFVNRLQLGWESTYLEWPIQWARMYLGGAVPPDRTRRSLTVVWFTKDAREQRTLEGMELGRYIVVDGQIFAGPDRKWSRTRLEPTSAEEQQRYKSTPLPPLHFVHVDGWSQKSIMPAKPGETRHPIEMNGEALQVVVRHDPTTARIDVLLQGKSGVTELLKLDQMPRRVTRNEYVALMQK